MTMAQAPRDEPEYGGPTQIQSAWELLAGGAMGAARTLRRISAGQEHDGQVPPPAAQVMASKTILQMVGFGPQVVPVRIVPPQYDPSASLDEGHVNPAKLIKDRMALLRQPVYDPDADSGEIIDAVIVDSTD